MKEGKKWFYIENCYCAIFVCVWCMTMCTTLLFTRKYILLKLKWIMLFEITRQIRKFYWMSSINFHYYYLHDFIGWKSLSYSISTSYAQRYKIYFLPFILSLSLSLSPSHASHVFISVRNASYVLLHGLKTWNGGVILRVWMYWKLHKQWQKEEHEMANGCSKQE